MIVSHSSKCSSPHLVGIKSKFMTERFQPPFRVTAKREAVYSPPKYWPTCYNIYLLETRINDVPVLWAVGLQVHVAHLIHSMYIGLSIRQHIELICRTPVSDLPRTYFQTVLTRIWIIKIPNSTKISSCRRICIVEYPIA